MNFSKKIQQILDHYKLSPGDFSNKMEIQRSSISHLLSKRNKPSIDFIVKLSIAFPNLNLEWFIKDVGPIEKSEPDHDFTNVKNTTNHLTLEKKCIELIKVYDDNTFEVLKTDQ